MAESRRDSVELRITGMDCAECARTVEHALEHVPGVLDAGVLLSAEKARIEVDREVFDFNAARDAVHRAGYGAEESSENTEIVGNDAGTSMVHLAVRVGGLVAGAVLFVVVVGEWLGLFERVTDFVPWWVGLAVVIVGGYPVFLSVVRAALRKRVISHTLMTLGVIAALVVGEWITAAVVVFFMRVGDATERMTTERSRRAIRDLSQSAPQQARVVQVSEDGGEVGSVVPLGRVHRGDLVRVRPGERIPVDGRVVSGSATVDQAAITGEAVPADVSAGDRVYAATIASLGSILVEAERIGSVSVFGKVVRLVEEAEQNRGETQRLADRFSEWYLPVVIVIAGLTFLLSRDPLATAAVLVVACSCGFALATPIAMVASIGAAAKRGVLIRGGRIVEALDAATVLLIDKTGTLTVGRPEIVDHRVRDGHSVGRILSLVAAAEKRTEHPLGRAIVRFVEEKGIAIPEPTSFRAIPGRGVVAEVDGRTVEVGALKALRERAAAGWDELCTGLPAEESTVLAAIVDDAPVAAFAAGDEPRPDIESVMEALKRRGFSTIELLTGDGEAPASRIAGNLGIAYRAELLPEDKIEIVRSYQDKGQIVVMIGDGVNDAPALAQADVGVAVASGSDIALETADVSLLRDDWTLVPGLFESASRTMRVVKANIGLTAIYNLAGIALAAVGILPPILAAAAQSIPDLGILANSSRLIRRV